MKENINNNIIEIFNKENEHNKKYSDYLFTFLEKANNLVEFSENLYQIEHTIRLNEISLKYFVLNSKIGKFLKERNIYDYSSEELKKYIYEYEQQNSTDESVYILTLDTYESLEEVKEIETSKINYEIEELSKLVKEINLIKTTNKDEYQKRVNEQKRLISELKVKNDIKFIEGNYEPERFLEISKGLEDEDWGVRLAGIRSLGDLGTEESVALIKKARRKEKDKDFMLKTMEEMRIYTKTHFGDEERYMQKYNYGLFEMLLLRLQYHFQNHHLHLLLHSYILI